MAINLFGGLQETFNRRHGTQTDQFSTLEDFSDRLNRFYTTAIILILAGVTITTVYFLKPISCTLPHAPSSGFTSYAESVCWVQGTIGLDKTDKIPGNEAEWIKLRAKSDMSFYQWVPFCLAIQAILFFIPYLIWQALSVNTLGENFNYLITRAKSASMTNDSESRSRLVKACANQLNLLTLQHADKRQSGWARFQRAIVTHIPGSRFFLLSKRLGNQMAIYYLMTKSLYVVNCIGQLFLIMYFIDQSSAESWSSLIISFSTRLFNTTMSQKEWGGSDLFPLQTLCPIRIPELGKRDQLYTAICTLPVNMLNVKIYLFLWIWILAVLLLSVLSTIIWVIRLLIGPSNRSFLIDFLKISLLTAESSASNVDNLRQSPQFSGFIFRKEEAQRFYEEIVGLNGTFLIRMLRLNAGDVITGEILVAWWEICKRSRRIVEVQEKWV